MLDCLERAAPLPAAEINAIDARYADLWRFYVFVPGEAVGHAAAVAAEYFDYAGEHAEK